MPTFFVIPAYANCCEDLYTNFYTTLKWFQASQLVLRMEKTKIVKFTPSDFSHFPLHITSAEHLPVETNGIQFVGPQLDSQVSWKLHINDLIHKLSSVCYIMRRLSCVLNIQTLRTLHIFTLWLIME